MKQGREGVLANGLVIAKGVDSQRRMSPVARELDAAAVTILEPRHFVAHDELQHGLVRVCRVSTTHEHDAARPASRSISLGRVVFRGEVIQVERARAPLASMQRDQALLADPIHVEDYAVSALRHQVRSERAFPVLHLEVEAREGAQRRFGVTRVGWRHAQAQQAGRQEREGKQDAHGLSPGPVA